MYKSNSNKTSICQTVISQVSNFRLSRQISGKQRRALALLLCLFLVLASPMRAQVGAASLSGEVQDSTGAVVPGAAVTAHNVQTGADRTSRSNGAGVFTFAALPSGNYNIIVSRQGFSSLTRQGIHLDPGDDKSVTGLQLGIASAVETVTVNQNQQGLSLDSGQLSSTISSNDIEKLSVTGREATELLRTLPGFTIRSTDSSNTAPDFSEVKIGQGTPYASNGSPIAGITLKLDGANLTDAGNFGANIQNINYSFISEIQVQTSNFGADQSNGPVVVTGVTKAGTSQYHGSVYTIARISQLNSTDWFANYSGTGKPSDRYIYPGLTFSGPVPHFKKLTFFLGGEYDAQRDIYAYGSASSSIIHALVPTAAMRGGDFSATALQSYLGPMYNNVAYAQIAAVPTFGKDDSPLSNGNISAFLDPGAKSLVNTVLPLPNRPMQNGSQTGIDGYNYSAENLVNDNVAQITGRTDYAVSNHDTVFVRYSYEKQKQGQPQVPYYSPSADMGSVNTPGGGFINDIRAHTGAANYVHIFTPSLTNELFATVAYFDEQFRAVNPNALSTTAAGYPYSGTYKGVTKDIPQLADYNYDGLPLALYPDQTFGAPSLIKFQPSAGDNVTKVFGAHTVKTGVFGQRITNNQAITNGYSNGEVALYSFPNAGTPTYDFCHADPTNPNNTPIACLTEYVSGNYLANFMEGMLQSYSQQNSLPRTNLYFWNVGFYGEDTWRVRPNFVLDYGVRLEHIGAWQDKYGIGAAVWQPNIYYSNQGGAQFGLNGFNWHALDKSIPNSGTGSTPLFAEPRVGFSWNISKTGKTILRGGLGSYRFHDSVVDVSNAFQNTQGLRQWSLYGYGAISLAGAGKLQLPATSGSAQTQATGLDPTDHTDPLVNNYSLTLVQMLPAHTIFQLSYVGNNSNSLLNNSVSSQVAINNVNAIPMGTLYTPAAAPKLGCAGTVCTPNQVSNLSPQQIQAVRPYIYNQGITVPRHEAYSNYNGIQAVLQRQVGKLNFNFNYTFGKALGIIGSAADFNWTEPTDSTNLANNYGVLNFDRSQVFNATYSYSVGKVLHGGFLAGLANGWLISGITNVQSGGDFQGGISVAPNFNLNGYLNYGATSFTVNNQTILGTPDIAVNPTIKCGLRSNLAAHQYINGNCLGVPNIGTNGPRFFPYIHGPAYIGSDLTAEKGVKFRREQEIRFRIAGFNFLNHPLNSFIPQYANEVNLVLGNNTPGAGTADAKFDPSSQWGFASYKQGRRLVQLSATYSF
jgi:hypothetical protein